LQVLIGERDGGIEENLLDQYPVGGKGVEMQIEQQAFHQPGKLADTCGFKKHPAETNEMKAKQFLDPSRQTV
jgi:hypothetical protein